MASERPVGVFDSGVGGVSVLRDMARLLPGERFVYYGDSANAPYGEKTEDEIRALALNAAKWLVSRDVKALVVACNTATSAAVEALREALPMPVVGMEPALKPAAMMTHGGKALVLATPATLRQKKFLRLYARYGRDALICPCPGLMNFAEREELDGEPLMRALAVLFAPFSGERLDACVLGCTHYVFLKRAIARALPGVPLVDGNDGTARRLQSQLEEYGLLSEGGRGGVSFYTSGSPEACVPLMERLFNLPIE